MVYDGSLYYTRERVLNTQNKIFIMHKKGGLDVFSKIGCIFRVSRIAPKIRIRDYKYYFIYICQIRDFSEVE